MRQGLCTQLVEDTGQQIRDLLVLAVSGHRKSVGGQGGLHLWVVKVDHCAVVFDHVDFFNAGDVVDLE